MLEEAIKEIIIETKLDSDKVHTILYDWATPLMRKGIIVKLSIKRWRARYPIQNYDLGFDEENDEWNEFSKNFLNFGSKYLLPKRILNEINKIENKARKNLENHSLDTIWGNFVPFSSYSEWKNKNEEIKKDFYNIAEKIYTDYPVLIKEVLSEYKKHSRTLYEKSNKKISYEEFEKRLIDSINLNIIPADQFKSSFIYEELFFFIPIPSDIQNDLYVKEKVELDRIKINNEKEEVNKERQIRSKIIEETTKLKKDYIEKFLESTVGEIRNRIINIITEIKRGIEVNNESVSIGGNRKKLLSMIEKIKMLDFYDDVEVQRYINQLHNDLTKDKEDRSDNEIKVTLNDLENAAKSSVKKMALGRINLVEI
jgi:hypothetical protein